MKLPNAEKAVVPQSKVLDYLLSEEHPQGRYKAVFFNQLGFERAKWQTLASALKGHAKQHDVSGLDEARFGTSYVIDGTIDCPIGVRAVIRTVWFIEDGGETPRLVTAYPFGRSTTDAEGTR